MATYRIGIGTEFKLDGGVGIGTDTAPSGLGNLKVEGTFKTEDLDTTSGIATFTRYAGFAPDNLGIDKDTTLTGEHQTTSDIVVGVNSTFTVSTGATVCISTVESISLTDHFSPPCGGVEDREECPVEGTVRFNKDLNTLEFYNGVDWRQFTVNGASGRAVFGGGNNATTPDGLASIEYMSIPSQGNVVNFGDLTRIGIQIGGMSSNIRGIFAGGDPGPSTSNVIDYITIASEGNATDFGDTGTAGRAPGAAASQTRGLIVGVSPGTNVIEYVEIMTTGNSLDFGDLTTLTSTKGGATSSPTRFFYNTGAVDATSSVIEFGIIASKGNTTTFGDITGLVKRRKPASNTTRALFAGGYTPITSDPRDGIQSITMSSEGNAVEFGNLVTPCSRIFATGDERTCILAGGNDGTGTSGYPGIQSIKYSSSGTSVIFGDLATGRSQGGSFSDSHGGLGGY